MDGFKRTTRVARTRTQVSANSHRRVQKSVTLNRKFVSSPAKRNVSVAKTVNKRSISLAAEARTVKRPVMTQKIAVSQKKVATPKTAAKVVNKKEQADVYKEHKTVRRVNARMLAQKTPVKTLSAKEEKNRSIERALRKMYEIEKNSDREKFLKRKQGKRRFWQSSKFVLASVVSVFALAFLGYFLNMNMPDISVRVAAAQAGIDKSYPSYTPKGYKLKGLASGQNDGIVINFANEEEQSYQIREEKSSWDSTAVLTNYVKPNWGDDYTIMKSQGLTIYVSTSGAVWVNGGVFYQIIDGEEALSVNDLHDIAVSL